MALNIANVNPLLKTHKYLKLTPNDNRQDDSEKVTTQSKKEIRSSSILPKIITVLGPAIPLFLLLVCGKEKIAPHVKSKEEDGPQEPIPTLIAKPYEVTNKGALKTQVEYVNPYEAADELRKLKGFKAREEYLNKVLEKLNPQLLPSDSDSSYKTALDVFNERNNLSLLCMGIKKDPHEFVFIDKNYFLGKSHDPLRIALSFKEVENTITREEIINLLQDKLNLERQKLSEQYSLWAKPYKYDFSRDGNTACMMVLALSNLSGMESDLVRELEIYKNIYYMPVEAICIDDAHIGEYEKLVREKGLRDLPAPKKATKGDILENIELVIKKAVDEGKKKVMIHIMAHGSDDGTLWASDKGIVPIEMGEVLSRSYKGKPLCDQIEITIWAGTCYSGRQLDGLRNYFEARKSIGVKGLRVLAESKYTVASAGLTPDSASLISDKMTDKSGPLDYYSSWYREYLAYLQSRDRDLEVRDPVSSFLHQIRFGDLMSRYDSPWEQDAQGFHYYNDLINKKSDGQYFTREKGKAA